jgi:hypothetical protein
MRYALKITAPCTSLKPRAHVASTKLGSVRNVAYSARWGTTGTPGAPRYLASVLVLYFHGSLPAVYQRAIKAPFVALADSVIKAL